MKSKIRVRRYQESDARFLSEIYYNTIHTVNAKDYTKEQLDAWAPYSSVEDYSGWKEKFERIKPFIALIKDTIVGFAEFEPNGHIDCFYVHHDFQNLGVGSALMLEIEKEGNDRTLSRIYAEVSITAKPFFISRGFQIVKQQTVTFRGVEFINFVMEKCYTTFKLLSFDDIPTIVTAFSQIGWDKPASLFEKYLKEAEMGERLIWVGYVREQFAGYVTLKWQSFYPHFKKQNIPEIMDLNVLPHFRKVGVGSHLVDIAEKEVATKSDTVGIGVGLYAGEDGGYGAAQRLYVKRGYIPDGNGLTYNYQPTIPGNSYPLDDDLVLWFVMKIGQACC